MNLNQFKKRYEKMTMEEAHTVYPYPKEEMSWAILFTKIRAAEYKIITAKLDITRLLSIAEKILK